MKKIISRIGATMAGCAILLMPAETANGGPATGWFFGCLAVAIVGYQLWKIEKGSQGAPKNQA